LEVPAKTNLIELVARLLQAVAHKKRNLKSIFEPVLALRQVVLQSFHKVLGLRLAYALHSSHGKRDIFQCCLEEA